MPPRRSRYHVRKIYVIICQDCGEDITRPIGGNEPETRDEADEFSGFVPWTAGRPFVWFDDEPDAGPITDKLAGDQPHKVIWVDEHTGLTQGHISLARDWLLSI